jgi:hypothetical protein
MLLSFGLFSLAGFLFEGWGSSLTFCFYLKKINEKKQNGNVLHVCWVQKA